MNPEVQLKQSLHKWIRVQIDINQINQTDIIIALESVIQQMYKLGRIPKETLYENRATMKWDIGGPARDT